MDRFLVFCDVSGGKMTQSANGRSRPSDWRSPVKHGTLIIGVRAKDGVVIGADTKVMRGGEAEYADKIHVLNDVAFATEGLTGLADDFLLLLKNRVAQNKGFGSLYEAKILAEDLVAELNERYASRVGEETVGVLVAGLENISSGPAKLYYLHSRGYAEAAKFRCTGSGGPYATAFIKFLHDENESVEENARRIAFVVHWVSEAVDTNVGGTPKIAMIRDDDPAIKWLSDQEVAEQKIQVDAVRPNLWKRILAITK
jgi:20S proteasome alpha/beta subunit